MTITPLGGMALVPVPDVNLSTYALLGDNNILCDAVAEAYIAYGQIWTADGASHTIDTTGSSSLGWMAGAVTFAAAAGASTFKVGLAAVDTTTGPPGRAVNVTNVITFDVNALYTSGTNAPTATAWNEIAPSAGTKTIANGDFVAFGAQMITVAGGDLVNVRGISASASLLAQGLAGVTSYTGGVYASAITMPNCVITFSDGTLGYFIASMPYVSRLSTSWGNTAATKEYGNFLQFPVPVSIVGIRVIMSLNGDCNLNLYSDPLGAPTLQRSGAIATKTVSTTAIRQTDVYFNSPYSLAANTPIAVAIQPTTVTLVSLVGQTMNSTAHQSSHELGTNCYAVNRGTVSSGTPFAAQNSGKDLISIAALLGGFDAGGGGGAATYVTGIIGG